MTTKTPEEIFALKSSWNEDPHWDIEETEGFEAHREELLAFRRALEKKWADDRNARILARMNTLRADAISYEMGFVSAFIDLEDDVQRLREEMKALNQTHPQASGSVLV